MYVNINNALMHHIYILYRVCTDACNHMYAYRYTHHPKDCSMTWLLCPWIHNEGSEWQFT